MTRELTITQPFDLELSLTMGQAFRWRPLGDGWLSGVLGESLIHIRQTASGVAYRVGDSQGERAATTSDDAALRSFFREDAHQNEDIYADISRDPKMATIIMEYPGLRVLRQDPWECLVAYLCSANNNLNRISNIIQAMAESFGATVALGQEVRRRFPSAKQLATTPGKSEAKLRELRLGLKRAPTIIAAAQQVCTGELDWEALRQQPYHEVKQRLMQCSGIGPKIADCIALFALDQMEAFPVDIWVWRAITEAYPEWGFPETGQPTCRERRELVKRARSEFGEYAGYANQYLFYWRRKHGKEPLSFGARWRGKFRIAPPEGRQIDDQYLKELRYEYLKAKYLSC